jgi:DNA-binding transcriptional LysR family regulator
VRKDPESPYSNLQVAQLETFLRILSEGSFTRAALALGITQSSASARIASLEEELGERVFVREHNRAVLTDAGRALIPYAEQMTYLAHRARSSVRSAAVDARVTESLRIGSNAASAVALVPWLVRKFRKSHEAVVVIEVEATRALMPRLMEGAIAFAFVNPHLAHESTEVLWSHRTPSILVAPAGHPFAARPRQIEELQGARIVACTLGPTLAALEDIRSLLEDGLRVTLESSSAHVVKMMIQAGEGIGFLPAETVADALREGSLVKVEIVDYVPRVWEAVLVRWRGKPVGEVEAQFLAMLKTIPNSIEDFDV